MHLKSSQCSSLFVRTCSGNHGNISRLPLTVLSTNTLRRKAPPPLRMYQTTRQDGDAPLDIWSVIKPGHVREKIAIFAPDGAASDEAGGGPAGGPSHAARAGKAKGSREGTCKRRRRSENNRNLQQDARTRVQGPQQPSPRRSGQRDGEAVKTAAEEEQTVSVVEMVAFLEQRAGEQEPDSKLPLALQRSSACITLSRAPPPELRGEEPESIRVSDMVAKLESECLKRRTEGDLSRSNSLSRTVGRVLLAARGHSPAPGDHSPAPCRPSSPSSLTSLPVAQSVGREPTSYSEPALITPPSGEAQGAEPLSSITEVPHEKAEPLPGLLFLSGPQASQPRPLHHIITFDTEPSPSQPHPPTARCDSGSQSERRRADGAPTEVADAALCRRAPASQDFLSLRRRLQRLLEPRPLLAALPPHLLLRLLRLLPTRSLAALKCSCRYFLFVIDHYSVRPADSLWVSDPRYRDDPCKQCKRRCGGGGDVSACRWHHKPYCQALPGGPGFWMCCRGARRDAPGCNVGLHDNRWVPAFHSINAPIYKRGRHDD